MTKQTDLQSEARKINFKLIFAGVDYSAFQKADQDEAKAICDNSNARIELKD